MSKGTPKQNELTARVREAMQFQTDNSVDNTNEEKERYHSETNKHMVHDMAELPELPDFTKRPKILPTNMSMDDEADTCSFSDSLTNSLNTPAANSHANGNSKGKDYFYNVQNSGQHSKNASVSFFSDELNDEHTFNELPLNEILDDFEYDELDEDNKNNIILEGSDGEESFSLSRDQTPDPHYQSLGNEISRSESPFLREARPEYTTEIPSFYDSANLHYPYKSPLDYSDEDFEKMNHFEFLKDLKFELPPLLPVYLNSNLLNDSNSKNYKTFPYQFQESTVPNVNEIYKYRINDLHIMDKYSTQKVSRPLLLRSGSSNSSITSASLNRTGSGSARLPTNKLRHKLTRENSSNSTNTSKPTSSRLKHSDKLQLIERNLIPHHVMLNHLITCNLNKDGYITSSCITRYKGKFITQIMFFSNELEQL